MAAPPARPRLAVWKFSSCDGCQLTLLNCEDELLALADEVEIGYFAEATRAVVEGPYDVSLVEGSVSTSADLQRIHEVRAASGTLVAIGACATTGGIQALRNTLSVAELAATVYARPEYVAALDRSTPVSAHVAVDVELAGCPIDRTQLLEVLGALLHRRPPRLPSDSVCLECKRRGNVCVTVAHSTPCLGPVTRTGCGAICPSYGRGCYGCFGPSGTVNAESLTRRLHELGMAERDVGRAFATVNVGAPVFAEQARRHGEEGPGR